MMVIVRRGGVIELSGQQWARLAAIGVLVAALGLSACGRKGPLDPPPSAAIPGQSSLQPAPADPTLLGAPPLQPGVDRDGKAVAPPPSGRQPFFLDWLVE